MRSLDDRTGSESGLRLGVWLLSRRVSTRGADPMLQNSRDILLLRALGDDRSPTSGCASVLTVETPPT